MPGKPLDGVHDFSRFRSGDCFYEEFPTNKIGPFGKEYRNDIICKCKYNGHDS